MLNFGWAEMLVIGVVALIVIGPDDLPDMFRQIGRFTGKLRNMSREFSRAMEQAAKDTGVKDVARDLKAATSTKALGLDAVKSAADKFEKWDPIKNAAKPASASAVGAKPLVPAAMPATPVAAAVLPQVPVVGAATQALYDKQALKAQVINEQSAKLRAIDAGTYQTEPSILPPAPAEPAKTPRAASKPKVAVAKVAVVDDAKPVPKPRKTVKKADPS